MQPSISPAPINSSIIASPQDLDQPAKKKQKRNKPTLSCEECVERKTKVCTSSAVCQLELSILLVLLAQR
jgi:hypothetical protein